MRTREDLFEETLKELLGPVAAKEHRAISSDAFNLGWSLALSSILDLVKGKPTLDDLSLTATLTELLKSIEVDLSEHHGGYVRRGLSRMFLEDITAALREKGLSYTLDKPVFTDKE